MGVEAVVAPNELFTPPFASVPTLTVPSVMEVAPV